jgi:hypothetical protein
LVVVDVGTYFIVKEEVIHAHSLYNRYLLFEAGLYKRRIRVCRDLKHFPAYLSLGYVLSDDRVAQSDGATCPYQAIIV